MVPTTAGACQDITSLWDGGPVGCSLWAANWLDSLEEASKTSAKYPRGCRVAAPKPESPILSYRTHVWKSMAVFPAKSFPR